MCGLAARGLWKELLCIMHGCEPYGHLSVRGKSPTSRQIASMVGMTTEREVSRCMIELEDAGVFSRSDVGLIYCRRMVRDNAVRAESKINGSKGGNPALIEIPSDGLAKGLTLACENIAGRVKTEERRERESEEERTLRVPKKIGRRLPDDWEPGEVGEGFARERGLDISETLGQFRDYWAAAAGRNATKLDWAATWRTWCRNQRRPGRAAPGSDLAQMARAMFGSDLQQETLTYEQLDER